MPKINQEEYEVFKSKSPQWNWIARNEDNRLFVYIGEPIKDNLEWDVSGFGRHWLFEMDNLFQFIQWEDEEPHNIAELIEEYEDSKEYKDSLVIEYFMDKGKESEESEVKDIEWLKEEMECMHKIRNTDLHSDTWFISKDAILEALNQLDEPEVLSSDWIDAHTYHEGEYDFYYMDPDELKEALVPKQERGQKYYVDLDTAAYVAKWDGNDQVDIYTDGISGSDEFEFHLTEQEIKDYDERFWPFAVKVKELEE